MVDLDADVEGSAVVVVVVDVVVVDGVVEVVVGCGEVEVDCTGVVVEVTSILGLLDLRLQLQFIKVL